MLQRLLIFGRIAIDLNMIKSSQMVTSPWGLHFSTPTRTKITTVNTRESRDFIRAPVSLGTVQSHMYNIQNPLFGVLQQSDLHCHPVVAVKAKDSCTIAVRLHDLVLQISTIMFGSAPSGAPFENHFGFLPESPETCFMKQVRLGNIGNVGTGRNGGGLILGMASRASVNPGSSLVGSLTDNSSTIFRPILSPRLGQAFYTNPPYHGPGTLGLNSSIDRARNRRVDSSVLQADSKRQYQLDLGKIRRGDDTQKTLMIKNIPNKYTSKMLLAAIDEFHKGTYDFYLPFDFKAFSSKK